MQRAFVPILLVALGGCSTNFVVTAASDLPPDRMEALSQCLRAQGFVPCPEMEAGWLRDGCARRRARDPTRREDWFGGRTHVDVSEVDGALSARFIASRGTEPAAAEGARRLEACLRHGDPDARLQVEPSDVFPDVR